MKIKLDNGKYKKCTKCNRELNVNGCVLHLSTIDTEECVFCHYVQFHMTEWKEDEENAIEPK